MLLNGYKCIYMPNHHRAFDNGCVYEHILKAEEKLKRELKDEEVVHHIDFNKMNNDCDNLMIFNCNKSHISYHGMLKSNHKENFIITENNGVYSCCKTKNIICPKCGNEMSGYGEMCFNCRNEIMAINIPSKDKLYDDLINNKGNFTKVGEIYNVTDNAVRKWCKKYNMPYHSKDYK